MKTKSACVPVGRVENEADLELKDPKQILCHFLAV